MQRPDLEFFFDPACPFCWMTSKWVRVVRDEIGLEVRWSYISLLTLNAPYGEDGPSDGIMYGRRAHRVIAAAAEGHGAEVVGPLYEAFGGITWESSPPEGGPGEALATADFEAALKSVDLPTELADAADDDSRDHLFEDGTAEALSRTGDDVGTPIITFDPDGEAPASFFGPVISELPSPEESVGFYRAIETAARVRSFTELKRSARSRLDLPLLAGE